MEKIFLGYDHDSIDSISEDFFTILGGEALNGNDFKGFMRIMGQEYNCRRSFINSFIRAKRNYSFDHAGVQHKDVVYFRGFTEMLSYLRDGKHFSRLFLGKVGFHDVDNLHNIYVSHKDKSLIVFPVFISDFVYLYLSKKEEDENFTLDLQDYYMQIKKKYWFIDLADFNIISTLKRELRNIEKILKIFEKSL